MNNSYTEIYTYAIKHTSPIEVQKLKSAYTNQLKFHSN